MDNSQILELERVSVSDQSFKLLAFCGDTALVKLDTDNPGLKPEYFLVSNFVMQHPTYNFNDWRVIKEFTDLPSGMLAFGSRAHDLGLKDFLHSECALRVCDHFGLPKFDLDLDGGVKEILVESEQLLFLEDDLSEIASCFEKSNELFDKVDSTLFNGVWTIKRIQSLGPDWEQVITAYLEDPGTRGKLQTQFRERES